MSLDVTLTKMTPTEVYGSNITHNLAKMALEVRLECGLTLYDVLWRPEEHNLLHAKDIAELLDEAWNTLLADPHHYWQFNPENGWGHAEDLSNFVYKYRNACWDNPDAEISVCR